MSCCICAEETKEVIMITRCNHEYHQSCFNKWVEICKSKPDPTVTCCICRVTVNSLCTIPSNELLRQEVQILTRINRSQAERLEGLVALKNIHIREIRTQAQSIVEKDIIISRLSKSIDQLIAELAVRQQVPAKHIAQVQHATFALFNDIDINDKL